MVAERLPHGIAFYEAHHSFNGAATRWSRRHQVLPRFGCRAAASTEPRLDGRGEACLLSGIHILEWGFNEPRLDGRGEQVRQRRMDGRHAYDGPATRWSRRGGKLCLSLA